MKKVIIVVLVVLTVIGVIGAVCYNHHFKRSKLRVNGDTIVFELEENFKGNRWIMYVNKKRMCSFRPLDGLQQETMGEYLVENFSCVLSDGDCRVYLIKEYSREVETSMTLIYTVDGNTFFFWNKEIIEEEETSKTLDLLYDYIPRQTLVDITSEKPERFKLYP